MTDRCVAVCIDVRHAGWSGLPAGNEKNKGNESFRVGESEAAVAHYSRSLALDPSNAVVWANRAMAYIRQELFDLAEADSAAAILLDPTYIKVNETRHGTFALLSFSPYKLPG